VADDEALVMVVYEEWRVAPPRGVLGPCTRCLALDGQFFRRGFGPRPPLHPHCHCRREVHHVEWVPVSQYVMGGGYGFAG
jgi:hypothetical protein